VTKQDVGTLSAYQERVLKKKRGWAGRSTKRTVEFGLGGVGDEIRFVEISVVWYARGWGAGLGTSTAGGLLPVTGDWVHRGKKGGGNVSSVKKKRK